MEKIYHWIELAEKEKPSIEELLVIFNECLSEGLKERVFEHAIWLNSDPDIDQNESFIETCKTLPRWPYILTSYAYKFRFEVFDICDDFKAKDINTCWTNIIKSMGLTTKAV